jgi:DNA mismatch repair ATPase MutL
VPLSLAVSAREADLAETETDFFQRLGFELARMGPETLLVRAVPTLLGQARAEALVRDVLAIWRCTAARDASKKPKMNCWPPWPATAACAQGVP